MKKTIIIWILFVFLIVIATSSPFPSPASEFYGTVSIEDIPASVGINVTAYDSNGTLCGVFTVSNQGYYGSLSCNGDDNSTENDEGAENNNQIIFYVNSSHAVAFGNVSWSSGNFHFVNLSMKNYPPYFDPPLATKHINESSTLYYDINCSDLNGDNLTYFDNSTQFNITHNSGIINWVPTDIDVGNNTYLITCSDGLINTTGNLTIIVYDVNSPPILQPIGPQIAVEGDPFFLYLYATDPDIRQNLTFNASTLLFTITSLSKLAVNATGFINFTPTFEQIGNYTIIISVSDGNLSDSETISLRIVRGAYCGDNSCNRGEDCSTCPSDCGVCPPPGPQQGASPAAQPPRAVVLQYKCRERWECSDWSKCYVDGVEARKCIDVSKCGTSKDKPVESQNCVYIPTCDDKIQNCHILPNGTISCEEGIDCSGPCQPCFVPTCFDNIQNCHTLENGTVSCEEGIDCSGPCEPCEEKKPIKLPIIEKPFTLEEFNKRFPWLFLILILILIAMAVLSDQAYVHHLSKKEIKEYQQSMKHYRKIRRRIYEFAINLFLISIIISAYIYLYSTDFESMKKFLWAPIALIIITPLCVSMIIRQYFYIEYRKKKKEELLLQNHKKQIRQLILTEDKLLLGIEKKLKDNIFTSAKDKKFENFAKFYNEIRNAYSQLGEINKMREQRLKLFERDAETENKIISIVDNKDLLMASKDYPEFRLILSSLKFLQKNNKKDNFAVEEILMSAIRDASMPHIKSVITSYPGLILVYNSLVDIYEFYETRHSRIDLEEEHIADNEKTFCRSTQKIISDNDIIKSIRSTHDMVSIYNSIVDLYDHYNKKQELYNRIKQLKREAASQNK